MRVIKIKCVDRNIQKTHGGNRMDQALEMSAWCREQGLRIPDDYDYHFDSSNKEIHFRFFGENESVGSMFAMRWMV